MKEEIIDSNKLPEEVITPQEDREESFEAEKMLLPKHPGGRPPIEKRRDIQQKYLRMFHARAVLRATYENIANTYGVSVSTVQLACRWVRNNLPTLDTSDYLKEAEAMIDSEIVNIITEISDLRKNGSIVYLPNGEPLVEKGEIVRRIDQGQINILARRKIEYQRMLMDVRGLYARSQSIIAGQVIMGNNVQVNNNGKLPLIIDSMNEADRTTFIALLEKYGRPPD